MRILTFTVPPEMDGVRGKVFLRSVCGLSYRMVRSLKEVPDGITADGQLLRTIDRVRAGQRVEIHLPADVRPMQTPRVLPLTVVYEDDDVTVLDKPAGMPTHPSAGHADDTLANAAAAYFAAKGVSCVFRPINRLDRNTSGLLVAAKHAHAAARLSGRVDKIYFAVTEGIPPESGTIDAPLRTMEGHGIRREIGAGGAPAVTHWRTMGVGADHALLRVTIDTGRTHQIRAHFCGMGFPLAGDDMYDGTTDRIGRHALHCAAVRFAHPVTGRTVVCTAPVPEDFAALLRGCGIAIPNSTDALPFDGEISISDR